MRKIVYYIASSIDGYISGLEDNVKGFVWEGSGVEKYLSDLANYDTVIMGRKTYESGYLYGLQPGEPAYRHMNNFIFSNNLSFENQHDRVHVRRIDLEEIKKIRQGEGSDIYLCGGGQIAGWLLENQQIDLLKIKLNPLILGSGVKLFEGLKKELKTELIDKNTYDHGLQIITYKVHY